MGPTDQIHELKLTVILIITNNTNSNTQASN